MLVSCLQASPKDMCCRGALRGWGNHRETGREVSQVHGSGGCPLSLDEETELARRAFLTQRQNPSHEGLTQWGVRAGC